MVLYPAVMVVQAVTDGIEPVILLCDLAPIEFQQWVQFADMVYGSGISLANFDDLFCQRMGVIFLNSAFWVVDEAVQTAVTGVYYRHALR